MAANDESERLWKEAVMEFLRSHHRLSQQAYRVLSEDSWFQIRNSKRRFLEYDQVLTT
jgi:hypothetical protein